MSFSPKDFHKKLKKTAALTLFLLFSLGIFAISTPTVSAQNYCECKSSSGTPYSFCNPLTEQECKDQCNSATAVFTEYVSNSCSSNLTSTETDTSVEPDLESTQPLEEPLTNTQDPEPTTTQTNQLDTETTTQTTQEPAPITAPPPPPKAIQQKPAPATRPGFALKNPLGTNISIPQIIGNVVSAMLAIAGAGTLVMFVWGGIQMVISQGDPGKISKGKDTLVWAVIGLVVIFTAYALVGAIIRALSSGTV